jgi:hypothetical protein
VSGDENQVTVALGGDIDAERRERAWEEDAELLESFLWFGDLVTRSPS